MRLRCSALLSATHGAGRRLSCSTMSVLTEAGVAQTVYGVVQGEARSESCTRRSAATTGRDRVSSAVVKVQRLQAAQSAVGSRDSTSSSGAQGRQHQPSRPQQKSNANCCQQHWTSSRCSNSIDQSIDRSVLSPYCVSHDDSPPRLTTLFLAQQSSIASASPLHSPNRHTLPPAAGMAVQVHCRHLVSTNNTTSTAVH